MIDILLIKTWIKSLAQSFTCQNGKLDHWIVMKRIKFTWKFLTHHHRHHQKGKTTRREKNKIHFVDKNLLKRCVGASCKAASIDWVSIRFRMCLNIDLTLCHDFPPAKTTTTNNKNKLRRVESNFFPSFFSHFKILVLPRSVWNKVYFSGDDLCKSSNVDCNFESFTFPSHMFFFCNIETLQRWEWEFVSRLFSSFIRRRRLRLHYNNIYVKVVNCKNEFARNLLALLTPLTF